MIESAFMERYGLAFRGPPCVQLLVRFLGRPVEKHADKKLPHSLSEIAEKDIENTEDDQKITKPELILDEITGCPTEIALTLVLYSSLLDFDFLIIC